MREPAAWLPLLVTPPVFFLLCVHHLVHSSRVRCRVSTVPTPRAAGAVSGKADPSGFFLAPRLPSSTFVPGIRVNATHRPAT